MNYVLVDSSVFLSLEDPSEHSHLESQKAVGKLLSEGSRLVTTNFVFDETYTLVLSRLGRRRAIGWGEDFKKGKLVQLYRVQEDHEEDAWRILREFSDKDFSYTDATSFAVASSLGIETALSLDGHFREYGRLAVIP